ncbi:hypothetical protein BGZ83_004471 [Gryganskiella cystojenkinii]|nr:hypothetical protein BGZ83_004471 [Gryganskiella cystojenkinii]
MALPLKTLGYRYNCARTPNLHIEHNRRAAFQLFFFTVIPIRELCDHGYHREQALSDNSMPWQFLPATFATSMAPGTTSQDGSRFILGGTRNSNQIGSSPVTIFDTAAGTWTRGPDLPSNSPLNINNNSTDSKDNSTSPTTFQLLSPGMTLDSTTGMVLQFGGMDGNLNLTNTLSILDTNANKFTWTYSGLLKSVPTLYAPIVVSLPGQNSTLIMGGCDQVNAQGQPVHCATFDTLYTLDSSAVLSSSTVAPNATQIKAVQNPTASIGAGPTMPPSRFMPCTVVLPDGNVFMMGGENPSGSGANQGAMRDAWILDTRNWTWFQRSIGGLPSGGIKGHSCQMANFGQIFVFGGMNGTGVAQPQPLSVIHTRNWFWTNRYWVPGRISVWVKVGLSLTVVVVCGAIIAGLVIRWRRNKHAAAITAANLEAGLKPDGRQKRQQSRRRQRSKMSEKDDSIELRSVSSSRRSRRHSGSAASGSASASGGSSESRSPRPRRERKRKGTRVAAGSNKPEARDQEILRVEQQQRQQEQEEPMVQESKEIEDQGYQLRGQSRRGDQDGCQVEEEVEGPSSPSSTLVPEAEGALSQYHLDPHPQPHTDPSISSSPAPSAQT